MFEQRIHRTTASSAAGLVSVIYHSIVYEIRKGQKAEGLGLLNNIIQTLLLVSIFYALFTILGRGGGGIRGDFLLFLLSGVFLFLTFNKSLASVFGSMGPTSPMMKHAPMNTIVAIASAALATLYTQVLSITVVLFCYHAAINPITIAEPAAALGMILATWFCGASIGVLFLAAKPWAPRPVGLLRIVYARLNLIFSGKLLVANTLPGFMLPYFLWNPLFHLIDQMRGHVFVNYNPHYTSLGYPMKVAGTVIVLGLLWEFYTRQHASLSWGKR